MRTPDQPENGSETPPQAAAPKARLGAGLRILLFSSLALNLVVVGLAAGVMTRAPFHAPPRPDHVAGALTFALSEEDRRAIGRMVFREMREGDGVRRDRQEEYLAVLAALRADPFDPQALRDSFALQRQNAMRLQEAGQHALLARVQQMSNEERAAFADRLERGLQRMGDKGRPPPRN